MRTCLLQITGYKQLYHDVENVRKKPYDSANAQHEKMLLKVSLAQGAGCRVQGGSWVHSPASLAFLLVCLLKHLLEFINRERLLVTSLVDKHL